MISTVKYNFVHSPTINAEQFFHKTKTNIDNIANYLPSASDILQQQSNLLTNTKLDKLLQSSGLLAGCLNILYTNFSAGKVFFTELMMNLMLKFHSKGIIFIDCLNSFPAYELVKATTFNSSFHDYDPHLVLKNIQLSRSFNYHQANEIITKHLIEIFQEGIPIITLNSDGEKNIKKKMPRLIIVNGLADLFLSKESADYSRQDNRPEWWPIHELQNTVGKLKAIAIEYQCIVLITGSLAPKSTKKPLGGTYFRHSAGILIHLRKMENRLVADLIKHPFLAPKTIELRLLKSKNKKVANQPLSRFL